MSEPLSPTNGHPGPLEEVPEFAPDAHSMAARKAVAMLVANMNQTGRLRMMPARDDKLNALLERQAVIMNSLALVLDALLVQKGEPHEVRFVPIEEQAAVPGPRLVVPA